MPSVIPTRPDGIGTERKVPVFRCRRQAVCASSFSKMAGSALYVRSPRVVFAAMTASHSSVVRSEASVPESAVPHAGNSGPSAGADRLRSVQMQVLRKRLTQRREECQRPAAKKYRSLDVAPCDSVTTVCTATAWKIEAAISSRLTFLANRFWISVLAKTPHREAIG